MCECSGFKERSVKPWLSILLLGLALGGCSWFDGDSEAIGVNLTLSTDRESYRQGEHAMLTLTVVNNQDEPVTLDFSTSQQYDFRVKNSSGVEVWRWSWGRAFLQIITQLSLEPGGKVVFQEVWSQRDNADAALPPGIYTVEAWLPSLTPYSAPSTDITIR